MKFNRKLLVRVLLGLGVLWLLINPGSRRIIRHEIQRRKIFAEIKRLRLENEKLTERIRLLETDKDYYGRVVRRKLGMLGPGEVEYRIISNEKKEPRKRR